MKTMDEGSQRWRAAILTPATLSLSGLLPDLSGKGGKNYNAVNWCQCQSVGYCCANSLKKSQKGQNEDEVITINVLSLATYLVSKLRAKCFAWVIFCEEGGILTPQLHRNEPILNCDFSSPDFFIPADLAKGMIELAEAGITEMRPSGTPNGWNAVYADKTERTFESWPQVELRPASNAKYRDNFVVDMLVNLDFVTRAQVDQAEADPASEALGVLGVLLHQELVTPEQARRAFAEHFGCKFITLGDREIASEIIAMVRPDLAKGIRLVPVSFDNGVLTVAVADPSGLDLMETLRHCTPRNSGVTDFAFAVVTQEDLDLAIDKYYL